MGVGERRADGEGGVERSLTGEMWERSREEEEVGGRRVFVSDVLGRIESQHQRSHWDNPKAESCLIL